MNLFPEIRCQTYIGQTKKAVWKKELELALIVDKICKENEINYFLSSGSLLGAVRHQGFIPWDDDMDIAMPRVDFQRFISTAPSFLPSNVFLQTSLTDKGRNIDYCQLRNTNTTAFDLRYRFANSKFNPTYNQGIFVDIFPLDTIGSPRVVLKQKRKLLLYQHIYSSVYIKKPGLRRQLEKLFWTPIFQIIGDQHFYEKRVALFNIPSKCAEKEIGLSSFIPGEPRFQWEKEWFSKKITAKFENENFFIPEQYDQILTKNYGDWHKYVQGTQLHERMFFNPYFSYQDNVNCLSNFQSKENISFASFPFSIELLIGTEDPTFYFAPLLKKHFLSLGISSQGEFCKWINYRRSLADLTDIGQTPETTYWLFYGKQIVGFCFAVWHINDQPQSGSCSFFLGEGLSDLQQCQILKFTADFLKTCGLETIVCLKK